MVLGSISPRRKELLQKMDLEFTVDSVDIDESIPADIDPVQAAVFLAREKAKALQNKYRDHILLTADTVVALDGILFGKPADRAEATDMLKKLSGKEHLVVTGICLMYNGTIKTDSDSSSVTFNTLTDSEVQYYVDRYKPFDKAGGYGIQEWIGSTCISGIKGSYFNVMGLPVEKVYTLLKNMSWLTYY